VATADRPFQNPAHHRNVIRQMNFTYYFTARSSGLVTVTSPRLWKGEFYIFWIGLDYKNKTELLEARLSIRSINNLDDFFQSCVFLLVMEFVWRDEGISNHTEMNGVTLTKVGVVSNDVDVTFTGIYAPPTHRSIRPLLEFNTVHIAFNPSTH
jgi:hypothetical protein